MSNLHSIRWYVPSFYGDIRLEAKGKNETLLHAEALSPMEADALRKMRDAHCTGGILSDPWATREEFNQTGIDGEVGTPYKSSDAASIVLKAPLLKVERVLTKMLKGDRKVIRAVVFKTGPEPEIAPVEATEKRADEPAAGASVAQPTRGCPIPDFETVNVRATRVLKEFLSPVQLRDFERHQQFLAQGADTGTRYLLTSRNAGARFDQVERTSVFDVDRNKRLCVHDWSVPAAEELLAMLICFRLKGGERSMLELPEMVH